MALRYHQIPTSDYPGAHQRDQCALDVRIKSTPAIDINGHKVEKPANPGRYKTVPNHVLQIDGSIHFYTDPIHVPDEMEALCQWVEKQIHRQHPVVVAAIAHYNMVRIHSFDDGNGIGARLFREPMAVASA